MALERRGTVNVASVPQQPGRHTIYVPKWRPTSLNKLMYATVGQRIRLKKHDTEMVGVFFHLSKVPKATSKRRVSLKITLGPRQKQYDDDNAWKSCLDGLVTCGALVDDSGAWCERGDLTWFFYRKDYEPGTVIELEDL